MQTLLRLQQNPLAFVQPFRRLFALKNRSLQFHRDRIELSVLFQENRRGCRARSHFVFIVVFFIVAFVVVQENLLLFLFIVLVLSQPSRFRHERKRAVVVVVLLFILILFLSDESTRTITLER